MSAPSERGSQPGPAGALELAIDAPAAGTPVQGVAVLCHPHPLHGGAMDNKVVVTLARTFVQLGWRSVRFNFRGVGRSAGTWDEGRGEVDDALAVIAAQRLPGLPLVLAGFSFGGYVATQAAAQLAEASKAHEPGIEAGADGAGRGEGSTGGAPSRLILIAPAASRFALAPVPAGTLVVHGEADDVVPLAAVLDWARPQSLPITVVPGAGHFFHGQLILLKQIVSAAMTSRLP